MQFFLLLLAALAGKVASNEGWELVSKELSSIHSNTGQKVQYYCTWRNLWTEERHPRKFPDTMGRITPPFLFSHTKQYRPWHIGAATTAGVEKIVENGYTDQFTQELQVIGQQAHHWAEGDGFYVVGSRKEHFSHIPPIEVTRTYPWITGFAGMLPSPCWGSGFHTFDTVDEYQLTFFQKFKIRMWPMNFGTDSGTYYAAHEDDLDPPIDSFLFDLDNTAHTYHHIFQNVDGSDILPTAEIECQLALGTDVWNRPDCDVLLKADCETNPINYDDTNWHSGATQQQSSFFLVFALLASLVMYFSW